MNIYLLYKIIQYDNTFCKFYNKCLDELDYLINRYNQILITYNCVNDSEKKYFNKFNPIFSKFCLNYIKNLMVNNRIANITPLKKIKGRSELN